MDHPLVAGTIDVHCASNSPCVYPHSAISYYFTLIKKSEVADLGISVEKELTTPLIASLASTASGIVPEEAPFLVACYLCVLPKLLGVNIHEGSIFNAEFMAAMLDYDPVAAKWLEAHKKIVSSPTLHGHDATSIPAKFLPTLQGAEFKNQTT